MVYIMYILIHRHISFCIGLWWWYIHKYSNMQYLSGLASPVICTGGSRKSDESATKQGNAPHKCESGDHFNFRAGISPCGKGQMNCQNITHTSGTQTNVTIVDAFDTTPEVCTDLYKVAKFRGQVVLAVACTLCWLLVAVLLCQQDKHGKRKTTEKANIWILWILQLQVPGTSFIFLLCSWESCRGPSEMRTATCWSLIFRGDSGSSPYAWPALSHGEHPVRA